MIRAIGGLTWLALASLPALAQAAPTFEAASVKPAAPAGNGGNMRSYGADPGRINYQNATLKGLIMRAYGVKEYQVAGPDWLDTAGYDVVATFPPDATLAQLPAMLRTLLAERFRLKLRHETRDLPVYVLVVGKGGPKLKRVEQEDGFGMRITPAGRHLEGKAGMAALCDVYLSKMLDRPVVDMTGLRGFYAITLDWVPDEGDRVGLIGMKTAMDASMSRGAGAPPAGAVAASIFTALQKQLGLKLEQRRLPSDFLIVDRAERVPVDN